MTQFPAVIALSDLDGANGFRLNGPAGAYSGHSVASAGDLNGDGFADLIVGGPGSSPHGAGSGSSWVVFGKAAGFAAAIDLGSLSAASGFSLSGAAVNDASGWSVASAGDVNGDGLDDLVIGAPNAAASYVVFGKASGFGANFDLSALNGSNGFKLVGAAAGDKTGSTVASAGDVNGDGWDDIIVGAHNAAPHGDFSGASYVVFGKASGFAASIDLSALNGANGFKLSGGADYDFSGWSVASAGDINGDGFADVIVGADGASPNGHYAAGASYVVFGKASGFSANIDLTSLHGSSGFRISGVGVRDYAGHSVASAGDVNGDGLDDLIVGAFAADPNGLDCGASYVVFGKTGSFGANLNLYALTGSNGFKISGVAEIDLSGVSVASAGDVNGDGYDDLIVGAASADPHGESSGSSYVVFGKGSGFAANLDLSSLDGASGFRIDGVAAADYSGFSVASAGDVNGDGLDDLIVGAHYAQSGAGSSFVVLGRLPDAAVHRTGTGADQSLVGGDLNDTLSGLGGADRLFGHGGADHLSGGGGADLLLGGAGNDVLDGGKGSDTAFYADAPSLVNVSLALAGAQDTLGGGHDTLTAIENLIGSQFDDQLTGSAAANTLDGGGGDDRLQGGGGSDVLIGGAGRDTAAYADASAGVSVSLAVKGFQNTVSAGNDKLTGIENLTGSAFNDTLTGDSHANILTGGSGFDQLAGGGGADRFVYLALGDSTVAGSDLISDFTTGDRIDLKAIDANTGAGGDQAFHLGATPGHAGDIVVSYAAGPDRTTLSLYVDGDATADAAIQLSGNHTGVAAADFVL